MARGDSTILGYPCHKATTHFRGRDYIAWYTEEIPFPLWALLSSVASLASSPASTTPQREHIYTLVGFEKAPSEDYIYERARRHWFETTREVLAKQQKYFHEQPNLFTPDILTPRPPGTRPSSASPSPTIRSN